MRGYRYIENVATLRVDRQRCGRCGTCAVVCPHRIFSLTAGELTLHDPGLCMECGACARNCPVEAIAVSPGVGCAAAILAAWVNRLLGRTAVSGCC